MVALYFYEAAKTDMLTAELKKAYKELAGKKEKFEVVLLYLNDTCYTDRYHNHNEESFWKVFKTMPWLALPYKDPNLKKLEKIYEHTRVDSFYQYPREDDELVDEPIMFQDTRSPVRKLSS